jgi:hypothetical protein
MLFKDVMQEALNEWDWDDEIHHDDSDDTDYVRTTISIDSQSYSFVIWTDENRKWACVSMRSPIAIAEERRDAGAVLMNFFNTGIRTGKFTMSPTDGSVQYENMVDLEGTEPVVQIFTTLRVVAENSFITQRANAIGAIAFTKKDVHEVISDFLEEVNSSDE